MNTRRFTRGQWVRCPSGLVAMVFGYAGYFDPRGAIVLLSTDPASGTWQEIAPEQALEPLVTEPTLQATQPAEPPAVNPNAGVVPKYPMGRWN